jgi:hypothetical protein
VETVLMNSVLKFALMDLPRLGLEDSVTLLRRAFHTQLRRFSDEFDLSARTEELLKIATDALLAKMAADAVMELPLAA